MVAAVAVATSSAFISSRAASADLLPGEQTWGNGVSSYVFGTNSTIDYGSPNVNTLPSVQSWLKQGGMTLMRTWEYNGGGGVDTGSDSEILQRVQAIQNAGMQCMFMLGSVGDLTWLEHVVTLLGSSCNIYEFGNENDNTGYGGVGIANLTNDWNTAIPKLRAINPNAKFGGPATMGVYYNDGTVAPYSSGLEYFLAKTAASGIRADFISYHDYPCPQSTSEQDCLTWTPQAFATDQSVALGYEQQYYGTTVPTGISEYNFDPGTSNLGAWANDDNFMFQWTETAINAFIANHFAFATQFTSLNYSGYGGLDMFDDSSPYAPKGQFYGMADMGERNGSGATLTIPSSYPAPPPTPASSSLPAPTATPTLKPPPTATSQPSPTPKPAPTPTPTQTAPASASPTPSPEPPSTPPPAPAPSPTPAPSATATPGPSSAAVVGGPLVGNGSVEGKVDSNPPGSAQAYRYTATSSGTVGSLGVFLDTTSTASSVSVGLYADSGSGSPGSLVTSGGASSPRAGAWNGFTVPSAPVVAGRSYWLAVLQPWGSSGTIEYRDTNGTDAAPMSGSNTLGGLPSTWQSGQTWQSGPASMFALATTTPGPPSPSPTATPTPMSSPSPAPHPTPTATPSPSPTPLADAFASTLFGTRSVLGTVDSNSPGSAQAYAYTPHRSGKVGHLSVFLDRTSTAGRVVIGVYADADGRPGQLLTSGTITTPAAGAWNTVAVSTASVHNGDVYWLAILQPSGTRGSIEYRDTNGTGTAAPMSASANLGGLPSTWSTGVVWPAGPASAYASR